MGDGVGGGELWGMNEAFGSLFLFVYVLWTPCSVSEWKESGSG